MSSADVGLEGQRSPAGGIRTADAAVASEQAGVPVGGTAEEPLAGLQVLSEHDARVLTGMTRAMYPHDRLPDVHYERVVASLDAKAVADPALGTLLSEGVGYLATTTGKRPAEFASLPEPEQVAALTRLEETPFFTAVAAEVVVHLYSQPDVWPYFGYEGPSTDQGGYLHRGFDDLDWVEDAPDLRGAPVAERVGSERVGTEERLDLTSTPVAASSQEA